MIRTHHVRLQIAKSVDESAPAQELIVRAFRDRGVPPHDAAAAGIDESAHTLLLGSYLDDLEVHNGRLVLQFGSAADGIIAGKTLSLTPYETAEREVVWLCGNKTPDVGIEPLGFAAGGAQAEHVATSIEDRFLPRACK